MARAPYRAFNPLQAAVAKTYGGGDYAHMTHETQTVGCGDTLFRFIILELSDVGEDRDEAIRRMERAIVDLDNTITHLCALTPNRRPCPSATVGMIGNIAGTRRPTTMTSEQVNELRELVQIASNLIADDLTDCTETDAAEHFRFLKRAAIILQQVATRVQQ